MSDAAEQHPEEDRAGKATTPTPSRRDAPRLEQLLEQLCLNGLSESQWHDLAGLLRTERTAIRRYAESVHLCEFLRDYSGQDRPTFPYNAGAIAGDSDSSTTHFAADNSRSECGRRAVGRRVDSTLQRSAWYWTAVAVGVAFVMGLVGGIVLFQSASDQSVHSDATDPDAGVSLPDGAVAEWLSVSNTDATERGSLRLNKEFAPADRLGRITALSPEASSDGLLRPLQVGDELRRGEVIQLTRGVMRVELVAGPVVLIAGPAEFSIVADNGLFARQGRLTALNEGDLTMQTSLIAVECHNAEVALVADREASAIVHAFQGTADLYSNARRGLERSHLQSLKQGEGVEVEAAVGMSELSLTSAMVPKQLVRSWSQVTSQLHPYEQQVLSDKPLAYWPLYRVRRNRRVLDLTQNGYDGQAIGNWPAELSDASSSQVRGAYFDGESYIEPDRKPPVNLQTGFTIESWAKVMGGPEFQSIFTSRWVFESNTPSQQCFGFTLYAGDDDHWELWSGSGEYGVNWQELIGPTKVERNRWTHVAATFTPQVIRAGEWVDGVVRLFVDGEQVAASVHRMSLVDFEWPARIGAAEFVPKALTSWLFCGEIRDVALYDYVVDSARIEAHFREGQTAT